MTIEKVKEICRFIQTFEDKKPRVPAESYEEKIEYAKIFIETMIEPSFKTYGDGLGRVTTDIRGNGSKVAVIIFLDNRPCCGFEII